MRGKELKKNLKSSNAGHNTHTHRENHRNYGVRWDTGILLVFRSRVCLAVTKVWGVSCQVLVSLKPALSKNSVIYHRGERRVRRVFRLFQSLLMFFGVSAFSVCSAVKFKDIAISLENLTAPLNPTPQTWHLLNTLFIVEKSQSIDV